MYSGDMNWTNWESLLENVGQNFETSLEAAHEAWKKWNDISYGLTDSQILALPGFSGKVLNDITKMRVAYGALKTMYDLYHGLATQSSVYDFSANLAAF